MSGAESSAPWEPVRELGQSEAALLAVLADCRGPMEEFRPLSTELGAADEFMEWLTAAPSRPEVQRGGGEDEPHTPPLHVNTLLHYTLTHSQTSQEITKRVPCQA